MTGKDPFTTYWVPVILYAAVIFTLSSFSFAVPSGLRVQNLDKLIHLIEYGIFGYLLARAFLEASPTSLQKSFQMWAMIIAICYGFTDEIHQSFVPMRETSSIDLIFDGIGAILAQFFFR